MELSNCCSSLVYSPSNDWAICLDCKEQCDTINEE